MSDSSLIARIVLFGERCEMALVEFPYGREMVKVDLPDRNLIGVLEGGFGGGFGGHIP